MFADKDLLMMDETIDIESLRGRNECTRDWLIRRDLIQKHLSDGITTSRLISLSHCLVNVLVYGCTYPDDIMKELRQHCGPVIDSKCQLTVKERKSSKEMQRSNISYDSTESESENEEFEFLQSGMIEHGSEFAEGFYDNMAEEFGDNMTEEFYGNVAEEFYGNVAEEFYGNVAEEFYGNVAEEFYGSVASAGWIDFSDCYNDPADNDKKEISDTVLLVKNSLALGDNNDLPDFVTATYQKLLLFEEIYKSVKQELHGRSLDLIVGDCNDQMRKSNGCWLKFDYSSKISADGREGRLAADGILVASGVAKSRSSSKKLVYDKFLENISTPGFSITWNARNCGYELLPNVESLNKISADLLAKKISTTTSSTEPKIAAKSQVPATSCSSSKQPFQKQNSNNLSSQKQSTINQPSQKPNTSNQPSQKPNTSNQPSQKPNTSNQPSQKPNTSNQPSQKPNTSNQPSQKPNTSNQPSQKPNTSNQPSQKQNTSNQSPPKQNTSNQPSQKPNTSNQPSQKPNSSNQPSQKPNTGNQPSQKQNTGNQPSQKQNTGNQPSQKQNTSNQPSQKQNTSNQPSQKQNASNQPSQKQNTSNQSLPKQNTNNQSLPKQNTSSQSPPKQNTNNQSPPKQNTSNQSPLKQNNNNQSPPKQNTNNQSSPKQNTSNQSPPKQNNNNQSPPKQNTSNQSPQKQNTNNQSSGFSITWNARNCGYEQLPNVESLNKTSAALLAKKYSNFTSSSNCMTDTKSQVTSQLAKNQTSHKQDSAMLIVDKLKILLGVIESMSPDITTFDSEHIVTWCHKVMNEKKLGKIKFEYQRRSIGSSGRALYQLLADDVVVSHGWESSKKLCKQLAYDKFLENLHKPNICVIWNDAEKLNYLSSQDELMAASPSNNTAEHAHNTVLPHNALLQNDINSNKKKSKNNAECKKQEIMSAVVTGSSVAEEHTCIASSSTFTQSLIALDSSPCTIKDNPTSDVSQVGKRVINRTEKIAVSSKELNSVTGISAAMSGASSERSTNQNSTIELKNSESFQNDLSHSTDAPFNVYTHICDNILQCFAFLRKDNGRWFESEKLCLITMKLKWLAGLYRVKHFNNSRSKPMEIIEEICKQNKKLKISKKSRAARLGEAMRECVVSMDRFILAIGFGKIRETAANDAYAKFFNGVRKFLIKLNGANNQCKGNINSNDSFYSLDDLVTGSVERFSDQCRYNSESQQQASEDKQDFNISIRGYYLTDLQKPGRKYNNAPRIEAACRRMNSTEIDKIISSLFILNQSTQQRPRVSDKEADALSSHLNQSLNVNAPSVVKQTLKNLVKDMKLVKLSKQDSSNRTLHSSDLGKSNSCSSNIASGFDNASNSTIVSSDCIVIPDVKNNRLNFSERIKGKLRCVYDSYCEARVNDQTSDINELICDIAFQQPWLNLRQVCTTREEGIVEYVFLIDIIEVARGVNEFPYNAEQLACEELLKLAECCQEEYLGEHPCAESTDHLSVIDAGLDCCSVSLDNVRESNITNVTSPEFKDETGSINKRDQQCYNESAICSSVELNSDDASTINNSDRVPSSIKTVYNTNHNGFREPVNVMMNPGLTCGVTGEPREIGIHTTNVISYKPTNESHSALDSMQNQQSKNQFESRLNNDSNISDSVSGICKNNTVSTRAESVLNSAQVFSVKNQEMQSNNLLPLSESLQIKLAALANRYTQEIIIHTKSKAKNIIERIVKDEPSLNFTIVRNRKEDGTYECITYIDEIELSRGSGSKKYAAADSAHKKLIELLKQFSPTNSTVELLNKDAGHSTSSVATSMSMTPIEYPLPQRIVDKLSSVAKCYFTKRHSDTLSKDEDILSIIAAENSDLRFSKTNKPLNNGLFDCRLYVEKFQVAQGTGNMADDAAESAHTKLIELFEKLTLETSGASETLDSNRENSVVKPSATFYVNLPSSVLNCNAAPRTQVTERNQTDLCEINIRRANVKKLSKTDLSGSALCNAGVMTREHPFSMLSEDVMDKIRLLGKHCYEARLLNLVLETTTLIENVTKELPILRFKRQTTRGSDDLYTCRLYIQHGGEIEIGRAEHVKRYVAVNNAHDLLFENLMRLVLSNDTSQRINKSVATVKSVSRNVSLGEDVALNSTMFSNSNAKSMTGPVAVNCGSKTIKLTNTNSSITGKNDLVLKASEGEASNQAQAVSLCQYEMLNNFFSKVSAEVKDKLRTFIAGYVLKQQDHTRSQKPRHMGRKLKSMSVTTDVKVLSDNQCECILFVENFEMIRCCQNTQASAVRTAYQIFLQNLKTYYENMDCSLRVHVDSVNRGLDGLNICTDKTSGSLDSDIDKASERTDRNAVSHIISAVSNGTYETSAISIPTQRINDETPSRSVLTQGTGSDAISFNNLSHLPAAEQIRFYQLSKIVMRECNNNLKLNQFLNKAVASVNMELIKCTKQLCDKSFESTISEAKSAYKIYGYGQTANSARSSARDRFILQLRRLYDSYEIGKDEVTAASNITGNPDNTANPTEACTGNGNSTSKTNSASKSKVDNVSDAKQPNNKVLTSSVTTNNSADNIHDLIHLPRVEQERFYRMAEIVIKGDIQSRVNPSKFLSKTARSCPVELVRRTEKLGDNGFESSFKEEKSGYKVYGYGQTVEHARNAALDVLLLQLIKLHSSFEMEALKDESNAAPNSTNNSNNGPNDTEFKSVTATECSDNVNNESMKISISKAKVQTDNLSAVATDSNAEHNTNNKESTDTATTSNNSASDENCNNPNALLRLPAALKAQVYHMAECLVKEQSVHPAALSKNLVNNAAKSANINLAKGTTKKDGRYESVIIVVGGGIAVHGYGDNRTVAIKAAHDTFITQLSELCNVASADIGNKRVIYGSLWITSTCDDDSVNKTQVTEVVTDNENKKKYIPGERPCQYVMFNLSEGTPVKPAHVDEENGDKTVDGVVKVVQDLSTQDSDTESESSDESISDVKERIESFVELYQDIVGNETERYLALNVATYAELCLTQTASCLGMSLAVDYLYVDDKRILSTVLIDNNIKAASLLCTELSDRNVVLVLSRKILDDDKVNVVMNADGRGFTLVNTGHDVLDESSTQTSEEIHTSSSNSSSDDKREEETSDMDVDISAMSPQQIRAYYYDKEDDDDYYDDDNYDYVYPASQTSVSLISPITGHPQELQSTKGGGGFNTDDVVAYRQTGEMKGSGSSARLLGNNNKDDVDDLRKNTITKRSLPIQNKFTEKNLTITPPSLDELLKCFVIYRLEDDSDACDLLEKSVKFCRMKYRYEVTQLMDEIYEYAYWLEDEMLESVVCERGSDITSRLAQTVLNKLHKHCPTIIEKQNIKCPRYLMYDFNRIIGVGNVEEALVTPMHDEQVGYLMLSRLGWDGESGLGTAGRQGTVNPVSISLHGQEGRTSLGFNVGFAHKQSVRSFPGVIRRLIENSLYSPLEEDLIFGPLDSFSAKHQTLLFEILREYKLDDRAWRYKYHEEGGGGGGECVRVEGVRSPCQLVQLIRENGRNNHLYQLIEPGVM